LLVRTMPQFNHCQSIELTIFSLITNAGWTLGSNSHATRVQYRHYATLILFLE
jgi:hypothetical protein